MTLSISTSGSGPHLTLLHGWGLHGGIWDDIVTNLAEIRCVTVVDLPGHGASSMPEGDYTLQTLTTEIAQQLPSSTVLLGWSLGGMIAMQLAADYPDRVSKLILVASTPQFARGDDWPHAMDPQILAVFANNLVQDFDSTVKHFLALQVHGSNDERNTLRQLQRLAFSKGKPDPLALQGGLTILSQENIRQILVNITCPTLLIYGQQDKLVPRAVGEDLLDMLPNATLHMIKHAGHAPFLSHQQEFLQSIIRFLDDNAE